MPHLDQPFQVLIGKIAEIVDLGIIQESASCIFQESEQFLRRVIDSLLSLHTGICRNQLASGYCGRSSYDSLLFHQNNLGPAICGFHGRGQSCQAAAEYDHICVNRTVRLLRGNRYRNLL